MSAIASATVRTDGSISVDELDDEPSDEAAQRAIGPRRDELTPMIVFHSTRGTATSTRAGNGRLLAAALLPCLLLGLSWGTSACSKGGSDQAGAEASAPKRREAARVRTAVVEQREMVRTLSTTTVIESEREIKIFPRTSGVVTDLGAEEGDRVAAGAVLAVLDRRLTKAMIEDARMVVHESDDSVRKSDIAKSEADAKITTAQIKYDQAVRDYERNAKADLISAQALDNLKVLRDTAKNDFESAKLAAQRAEVEAKAARTTQEKSKLALERRELDDSYMEVTAPFEGVIASRAIKVGDSVGPGAVAFVLTDPHNLRAVFHRPQRELPLFLAAGRRSNEDGAQPSGPLLEIRAVPEALPGSVFRADLQLVSPSIDPQSGSFRVTVRMRDPIEGPKDAKLLPGMLVRLEIITERHPNALVVPKRALRREGEQSFVFLMDAGKARRAEVTDSFSDDLHVEVHPTLEGTLAAGMRVIVVGNRELEDAADVVEESAGEAQPGTTTTTAPEATPQKG
jgi:membrane fusion protein, multidrug efflux system